MTARKDPIKRLDAGAEFLHNWNRPSLIFAFFKQDFRKVATGFRIKILLKHKESKQTWNFEARYVLYGVDTRRPQAMPGRSVQSPLETFILRSTYVDAQRLDGERQSRSGHGAA